jgi:predicted nucleic acid-binding protein
LIVVVSDTSPIRALAHLDLLGLLPGLFDRVFVPPAVALELRSPRRDLPPVEIEALDFAEVREPVDQQRVAGLGRTLDPGESEALALALELGVEAILIDEAAGRATARQLGLSPIGVLGLLVRGKQRGLVASIRPLLDRLQGDLGFFMSETLRIEVLRLAGE